MGTRSPMALLLLWAMTGCVVWRAQAQVGLSCAPILNNGIYSTVAASAGTTAYTQVHQAACFDYTGYTYAQYVLDTATSTATGLASSLNTAAATFSWGVGPSGGSSSYFPTVAQFNDAIAKAQAYRATACSGASITGPFDPAVATLSLFIPPSVSIAYTSCLSLYNSGIKVVQVSGFAAKSIALDVSLVPGVTPPTTPQITGITVYPAGSAVCSVQGQTSGSGPAPPPAKGGKRRRPPPAPPGSGPSLGLPLTIQPNIVYSIVCAIPSGAVVPATNYTDVLISTSVGGSFHALLFHGEFPTSAGALLGSVQTLQAQVAALRASVQGDRICINNGICLIGYPEGILNITDITGFNVLAHLSFVGARRFVVHANANGFSPFFYVGATDTGVFNITPKVTTEYMQGVTCLNQQSCIQGGQNNSFVIGDNVGNPVARFYANNSSPDRFEVYGNIGYLPPGYPYNVFYVDGGAGFGRGTFAYAPPFAPPARRSLSQVDGSDDEVASLPVDEVDQVDSRFVRYR